MLLDNERMEKSVAIILAAGSGKRMGVNTPKQYMKIKGKPILYYTLKAFECSNVDEVILVVGHNEIGYVTASIVNHYGFAKVTNIVEGGSERYLSVYEGLKSIASSSYIMVHDGARPMISPDLINKSLDDAKQYGSSIVAVPSKDTIRIVNRDMIIEETPERSKVWNIQTPQTFESDILESSYDALMEMMKDINDNQRDDKIKEDERGLNYHMITDDAMVVELVKGCPLHITLGEYSNIKITTIDDLKYTELYLDK